MKRREFIKESCMVCVGGIMASLLEGCATPIINASILGSDMIVPLSEFRQDQTDFRRYIIASNELLQYPICVYRFNEMEYKALLMRCTHQGTTLQVFGEKLECPAHGSEFDSGGIVQHGPASANLRTLPITLEDHQLRISLK